MSRGLDEQWRRWTSQRFPRGLTMTSVDGINLVDLDATAAGHVSAVLKWPALLDERRAALVVCRQRIARVLPHLADRDDNGHAYFAALAALTDTALNPALLTTST